MSEFVETLPGFLAKEDDAPKTFEHVLCCHEAAEPIRASAEGHGDGAILLGVIKDVLYPLFLSFSREEYCFKMSYNYHLLPERCQVALYTRPPTYFPAESMRNVFVL